MKNKITNLVFLLALLYFTDSKAQSPVISSFSPSAGPPGTLLSIQGSSLDKANTVTIGGKSALIISLSASSIAAYVMPGSVSGTVSVSTAAATGSSSESFTVNPTPFPSAQQGDKLVGTGNAGIAESGRSVAISADGNTVIIGASNDNTQQGAAWIYVRNGNVWTQQGPKLVGSGNVGPAQQGKAVGISADGSTIIIGGNYDNGGMGAAWIFTRKNNIWTQQGAKLVGTGFDDSILPVNMGYSVGMSADGNTVILGAPYDNSSRGAAWIFSRKDNVWTQQGEKLFDDSSIAGSPGQGISVGLSGDGNTAILGAPLDNNQEGAAYVFFRSGTEWNRQAKKLNVAGYPGTKWQGISVALNADGTSAIVGASVADNAKGAAWVFLKNGAEWIQKGNKLAGTGSSANAAQGWSVAMSADGNTVLMGGYADNWTNGAVWVFSWSNYSWVQKGPKLTGTGNTGMANQGQSLALSADGSTAIVGGNIDNERQGASWIFTTGPAISISLKNYTSTFCKGVSSTVFSYDGTEGNPDLYSIIWDEHSLNAGLSDVIDQALPVGSFVVNMPASLPDGIYNGALKVRNSSTGESSTGTLFTLTIPEPPKISPITGSGTVAVGANITLSTATATGVWTSNALAIAAVNPASGQVNGIAEGSAIITFTVTNAEGCSNSASFNLLVVSASSQQLLTFPVLPVKTYGDDDFSPAVFSADAGAAIVYSSSDPKVAVISATGQLKITGAGTALITASQAANSAVNASQILTVKPKALIIKAKDQNRVYGAANPELTLEYTGFVKGEDVSVFETRASVSTTTTLISSPGSYPIVVSGATAANYTISYQPGILVISKADQLLSFDSIPNKTMGDSNFSLKASVNSGLTISFTSSDNLIAEIISANQVKINNPGTVKIEAIQRGNANYNQVSVFREFTIYPDIFSVSSNSFTPNGDGINDQWILSGLESDKTAMVQIYSRYGRLVFRSSGYSTPWDGHYQGAKLPQGTYYYKISVRSGKQVVSGVVSIIY